MVVTVTLGGYIKRTPLETFRTQKRGGKGRAGMATKDEDAVTELFVTSTHNPVLFFSTHGKVYRLKVWRLPEGGAADARPADGEPAAARRGRDDLDRAAACPRTRRNGASSTSCSPPPRARCGATPWTPSPTFAPAARSPCASTKTPSDRLIGVSLLTEEDDVLLATRQGKAIRFAATDVREFQSRDFDRRSRRQADRRRRGHLALGPAGLRGDDRGTRCLSQSGALEGRRARDDPWSPERMAEFEAAEEFILTVCANGYGKRSSAYEYRRTNRGGQGHHQYRQSRPQRPGRRLLPRP